MTNDELAAHLLLCGFTKGDNGFYHIFAPLGKKWQTCVSVSFERAIIRVSYSSSLIYYTDCEEALKSIKSKLRELDAYSEDT